MINVLLKYLITTQANNVLNIIILGHIIHPAKILCSQASVVYKVIDPYQRYVTAKLMLPNKSQRLQEDTKAAPVIAI